jgi:His-Xaa-Ser system protein HxsD
MVKKKRTRTEKSDKEIKITVDAKIYPLEAVYGASYVFLDRAYVFLDGDPEKKIDVILKLKPDSLFKNTKTLKGEFLNELLNYSLRQQIAERNAKLREYIVGAALLGASGELNVFPVTETEEDISPEELPTAAESGRTVAGQSEAWEEDPMQIAVPWEEKYATDASAAAVASVKTTEKAKKKKTKK